MIELFLNKLKYFRRIEAGSSKFGRERSRPDLAPILEAQREAWTLYSDLSQVLRIASDDGVDPALEPVGLQARLARAGGATNFAALRKHLSASGTEVRPAFRRLLTA